MHAARRIILFFASLATILGTLGATGTAQATTSSQPQQNMLVMYTAHHTVVDYVNCRGTDAGPGSMSLIYEEDYTDSCAFDDHMYPCKPEDCGGVISDGTVVRLEPYMSYDGYGHLRSEQQLLDGWYAYAYVDAHGNTSHWDLHPYWNGGPLTLTEAGEVNGHMVTLQLQFAIAALYWEGEDTCGDHACSFK